MVFYHTRKVADNFGRTYCLVDKDGCLGKVIRHYVLCHVASPLSVEVVFVSTDVLEPFSDLTYFNTPRVVYVPTPSGTLRDIRVLNCRLRPKIFYGLRSSPGDQ